MIRKIWKKEKQAENNRVLRVLKKRKGVKEPCRKNILKGKQKPKEKKRESETEVKRRKKCKVT